MDDYINPLPEQSVFSKTLDVASVKQSTPKRIKIEYETTGKIKDFSKKTSE
ncbi:MAG TPA: hypothetical protein PLY36_08425 [Spirochaetota bacterium]|nr:hypothetical protein [Spirochaetota bacterium]